jgi:hypothetical protein
LIATALAPNSVHKKPVNKAAEKGMSWLLRLFCISMASDSVQVEGENPQPANKEFHQP